MNNKVKKSKTEKFWWALRKARNLTLRRLPSKHHEESWKNFEKVMEYRANFFMTAKIILFAYNLYTGDMQYMLSEKAINEGLIANVDLARKVWPIAHITVWVWFILCFWILFPMELCLHLEETLQTSLHVLPDRRRKCNSTRWGLQLGGNTMG